MKKLLYLFILLFIVVRPSLAQEESSGTKLRDKMMDYIQTKLSLSKSEIEKFRPVFMDYLKEMRTTKQEHKDDPLVLQQKIAELRLRYRDKFKPIIGEQKSNDVFKHERDFIEQVRKEVQERKKKRQEGRANKRTRALLQ